MKLANIIVDGKTHLALVTERGLVDAAGAGVSMEQVIAGQGMEKLRALAAESSLPRVEAPVYANVLSQVGKLVCVGLNYKAHAAGINMQLPEYPILFSKFANALAPCGGAVTLPPWEQSYDYEAELVIVMGKSAWNLGEEEAMDHVFGYTCGNDMSLRDAQMRSGQWLIGKTMPGFAPCGPCIVTADELDPGVGLSIRSRVNSELRQNGSTADMIFDCARIISYASRYIALEPGDLIFTGTPSGVALEKDTAARWLKPGDLVEVEIEGIGTLTNRMV